MSTTTVFISYSWDSPEHRAWVRALATALRGNGVRVLLDQWHAVPGDQLPRFMASAIRNSDFVLIICTTAYRLKLERPSGGASYEGDVIAGEILTRGNHRKFVPVLREGEWISSAPPHLLGKYYIDLRDGPNYDSHYRDLMRAIRQEQLLPPELGVLDGPATRPADDFFATALPKESELLPRHYHYLSSRKLDLLFPQLPNSVPGVDAARSGDVYARLRVLEKFLVSQGLVGTPESPRAYFAGRISAGCLLTARGVFYGAKDKSAKAARYVGLSGSAHHLLDPEFRKAAEVGDRGYLEAPQWEYLHRAKASFLVQNSDTAQFHSEVSRLADAESWKDERLRNYFERLERLRTSGAWRELVKEYWKKVSAPAAAIAVAGLPLLLALGSAAWIGWWALIPIALALVWVLIYAVVFGLVYALSSHVPTGDDSVCQTKRVTERIWSQAQEYDFLARTISVGACEGEVVVLGSPLFVALAHYEEGG